MLSLRKIIVLPLVILLAAALACGQSSKKSYVFKGTVTDVDASAKKLAVANEDIRDGWPR